MSDRAPQPQDKFIVRLPDGMRDRIRTAAEANNRSMNAEIVATLEEKYPAPERSFDTEKWYARLNAATARSDQILKRMSEISAATALANTPEEVLELNREFEDLRLEHGTLFDFSTDDDEFNNGTAEGAA